MTVYERRILAHVDIIGWSAACRSIDQVVLSRVVSAAGNIHSVANQYSVEKKQRIAQTPNAVVHPKYADIQWGGVFRQLRGVDAGGVWGPTADSGGGDFPRSARRRDGGCNVKVLFLDESGDLLLPKLMTGEIRLKDTGSLVDQPVLQPTAATG